MKFDLNKTTIALLLSLGFLVVAVLSVFGLIYVIESDAEALKTQAREIAFREAEAEEQFETTRLLEETIDERAQLQEFVLTEATIIDFITEIEAIAADLSLTFDTQRITAQEVKHGSFEGLTIDMTFNGPRARAATLLTLLEELPYHSHLENVAVTQSAGGEWNVNLTLFVTILQHDQ